MKRQQTIQKMQALLMKRREALRNALSGELSWLRSEPATAVGDEIDSAIDAEHDELNSQLAAAESRELAEINNALQSIREGTYGICEGCDEKIPTARLEAIPYATLCIKCQRVAESEALTERSRGVLPALGNEPGQPGGEAYLSEYEVY